MEEPNKESWVKIPHWSAAVKVGMLIGFVITLRDWRLYYATKSYQT